ncbi:hypothetical protein FB1_18740 [Flavobacterium branchiophilum NBRC 15030 = ATCC 35035]|nr:hypothetical protein FB1_18740 [Flavobacterium branchiophilum NBRC 15030 = ATCC 35035]
MYKVNDKIKKQKTSNPFILLIINSKIIEISIMIIITEKIFANSSLKRVVLIKLVLKESKFINLLMEV